MGKLQPACASTGMSWSDLYFNSSNFSQESYSNLRGWKKIIKFLRVFLILNDYAT